MNVSEKVHSAYIQQRRVRVLSILLAKEIPQNARVLDVGSGDGWLASLIQQLRPDLQVRGLDVLAREKTFVPVTTFDGTRIPESDASYDVVLFVDVLHHTLDPRVLLKEAVRISRRFLVIKDHTADGLGAHPTLQFMDRVGNRRYGVALPCNYWPEARWQVAFQELNLRVETWNPRLGLYPWPASMIFERGLHFISRLAKN